MKSVGGRWQCIAPRYFFVSHFLLNDAKWWQVAVQNKMYFLPATFYEYIKSGWESAEVKDTFLPAIFYENIQSTWESAEVKDTFF